MIRCANIVFFPCAVLLALLLCTSCGHKAASPAVEGIPPIAGLEAEGKMALRYAEQFAAYRYKGGYTLIDVQEAGLWLVVPQEKPVPEGIPSDVSLIRLPVRSAYLAASSAFALWRALGALPSLRLTSTKEEDWYMPEARQAMAEGSLRYAGKYSAPDYELLLGESCDLAIESTMIFHAPKVQEKLVSLGIPVFVDTSSREAHPLGRLEWVRLYGLLAGKETEAAQFFEEQLSLLSEGARYPKTGKTVAFFYVNQNGQAMVRGGADYISQLIDLAGGSYLFSSEAYPDVASKTSYVALSMEEFYQSASQADYLLYNNTLSDAVHSVADLCSRSGLFADFKAVRDGTVWAADASLYQASDAVGNAILDLHTMLTGLTGESHALTFLEHLE